MKDYSDISDFEVNKAVFFKAKIEYEDCIATNSKGSSVHYGDGANWHEFDPCNNPSDMWPLIVENEISLVVYQSGVWECNHHNQFFSRNDNPLRAAAIVFLMLNEKD